MDPTFDVIVAGGGLAGGAASLALARRGLRVAQIAPASLHADQRTTALLASSIDYLDHLGIWDRVSEHAAPLATMRIIDATERLFRAPELAFHSSEIGLPAFGYNIANAAINACIAAACHETGRVERVEDTVQDVRFSAVRQEVILNGGRKLTAALVVGADGRSSAVRKATGTRTREWSYPQTALVLDFEHARPHGDASTEFHTTEGPFTVVPLGDRRSSLVWVQRPEKAEDKVGWPPEKLALAIERQMQSMLGKVTLTAAPQCWKLGGMVAEAFGGDGWVLVGEAGHVFPPIGAQGFNLGIRDVELLEKLASATRVEDLPRIGRQYSRNRFADVSARTLSVDLLNRSLLESFVPMQLARAAGLHAMAAIGPLRRLMMREGVSPGRQWRDISERLARKARN